MLAIEVFHQPQSWLERNLSNQDFEELLEFFKMRHEDEEGVDAEKALEDFIKRAEKDGVAI